MSGLALPKPVRTLPAERKRLRAIARTETAKDRVLADALCRKLTLERARNRCEFCGEGGQLDQAHGFGKKAFPSVRWDGRNLFAACRKCHHHGHAYPDWWERQLRGILGDQQFEQLRRDAIRGSQPDARDVVEMARKGKYLIERNP